MNADADSMMGGAGEKKIHSRKTYSFFLILGKRLGLFLSQLFLFQDHLGLEIPAPYWEERSDVFPLYCHPEN